MPENYVESFHRLPEKSRVSYHLSAIKEGLSLDEALLIDSKKISFESSPKSDLNESTLTNLHTFSPKKT